MNTKNRPIELFVLMASLVDVNAQSTAVNHPATDDLGRALPSYEEVGDVRTNKVVAMFYWTWHVGHSAHNKAYDLSKIIAGHPEMVNDYDHPRWLPYSDQGTFFWTEPLFGFYDGRDKWVIRKQLEMLGAAGVDVLFYDATNGDLTWKDGYEAVGQVMAEARADGVDVPQFAFMLNFGPVTTTATTLTELYDDLYSLGKYQESWFLWDGKPAIMAYPEVLDDPSPPDTAGLRFTAELALSGIDVSCPSYNDNFGDLTLSLYAWSGNYAASVTRTPLDSQTFVDFADNEDLALEFHPPLSAGDYVWELTDARGRVGVWKYPQSTPGTTSYFNGSRVSGSYKTRIRYSSDGFYRPLTTGGSTTPVQIGVGLSAAKATAIRAFFTFRPGQPRYEGGPNRNDQWGWLENAPQNGYVEKSPGEYEFMTVGVAQNWSERTHALSAMNGPQIRGRSYTDADGFRNLAADSYLFGYNFQEQWDRALQVDPDIIFITGWNEWVVGRFETWQGVENAFPDQFDAEHSRDIEPMKGGYGDNYYYQMIANIRRFKGMEKPEAASAAKTIVIDGAFSDWVDVTPHFRASRGNVQLRNGLGYLDKDNPGQRFRYTNNTARNDIVGAKVARNTFNVYFYVAAANNLSPHGDPNWMQLLIDDDRSKATGWEGYDLMVDRYTADGKATLSTSSGDWNWTDIAEVDYQVAGRELEIGIPRVFFGEEHAQPLDLEFKWLDTPNPTGDIMDVYTDGEAAPSGRFNFHYRELMPIEVHNTGVARDGSVLPDGDPDLHWSLVGSADDGWRGPETYVVDSNEFPIPPWIENDATSKWISPRLGDTTVEPGPYTYRTVFDLTGYDPDSVNVIGRYSSDDSVGDVLVNGISNGQQGVGFDRWHSFSLQRGFRSGENHIDVVVVNGGTDPNPSGLRVEITRVSATPINAPTPGPFIRGDCNADGVVDISDVVRNLLFCFGNKTVFCAAACDTDGDGNPCTGVTDSVQLLMFLFRDGAPPPSPFPNCGTAAEAVDCNTASVNCR